MEEKSAKYKIETEEAYLGDILGNINKHGGLIETMNGSETNLKVVEFSITTYGLYNFEKWLKSMPKIQVSISKL